MSLGDAIPGGDSDALYTGDYTPSNPLSLDYYREKARQFQQTLNDLDAAARNAQALIDADIDPSLTADLQSMLDDYSSRVGVMKATAEAINAGAAVVNAAGGRFPELSIPTGLGFFPVLPVAAVAAIATAAVLIAWGVKWLDGYNQRIALAQLTPGLSDDQRSVLAQSLVQSSADTGISGLATIAKYALIGGALYIGYRLFLKD